jgi:hypothetical protein
MFGRLIACVTMLAACTLLAACSLFQKPDGTVVSAPDPHKIEAAAAAGAATASTIPVWGQAVGGLILAVGGILAAHYRGKEVGWTEAVGSPAQAVPPPTPPPRT